MRSNRTHKQTKNPAGSTALLSPNTSGLGRIYYMTGLSGIPIQYFLKDNRHLSAETVA
jgi:hypothetical protein